MTISRVTSHSGPEARATEDETTITEASVAGVGRAPARGAGSSLPAGAASLVARHTGGGGLTGAERVATAERAVAPLVAATGRGASALVARYAGGEWAGKTPQQVRADATLRFVQGALAEQPELADRLIEVRLRGASPESREIVELALAQRGASGAARYAAAEQTLAALSGLDRAQRGDVLGLMRAGESFGGAVAHERQELARLAREGAARPARGPSLQEVRRAETRSAERLAGAVDEAARGVGRALARGHGLSRGAEAAAGVGAATGTVGAVVVGTARLVVTGDASGLAEAAHDAEVAGGLIAGELTAKLARASATGERFFAAAAGVERERRAHAEATARGDLGAAHAAFGRMQGHARAALAEARALDGLAADLGEHLTHFDAAAIHAATHLLVSAVSLGAGGVPGEHAVAHGLGAAGAAAYSAGAEALAVKGISTLAPH